MQVHTHTRAHAHTHTYTQGIHSRTVTWVADAAV